MTLKQSRKGGMMLSAYVIAPPNAAPQLRSAAAL